jgi:two-component system, cell cycle response regulator
VTGRILVIEDDPSSQELMSYLLDAHGYATTVASRGDEGLAAARRARPDLVICDVQLPGLDGYAIAAQLKSDEVLKSVPLVAVTALAMVGDRERMVAAGFDSYLSKPIDPMNFVAQIDPLLPAHLRGRLSARATVATAPAPAVPARATIVVVDDTPENLELKRSMLEPSGYCVLAASTVAAGLELVRTSRPSLIISNVGLPDASGFDLLRTLKADRDLCSIPVMMITATHADMPTRDMAMRLGAWRFLLRPLDAADVLSEVESCLAEVSAGGSRGQDSGH